MRDRLGLSATQAEAGCIIVREWLETYSRAQCALSDPIDELS